MTNTTDRTGFVYILINPLLDKQLKIGRTFGEPEERKKQLDRLLKTTTANSRDFIVAYEEKVADCVEIENKIHKKLDRYRFFQNKEFFFNVPLKDAIRALIEIIDNEQKNANLEFSNAPEIEYLKAWNKLSFNIQQLIKKHINLDGYLSDNEIIECLRNIIDFSQDENERKLVLTLYKQINYRDNIRNWFNDLIEIRKKAILSYSNKELTTNEFEQIQNLKEFDCQANNFITEIKPLTIMKNLEILKLNRTKISDLNHIEKFVNLKELHFDNTKVNSLIPLLKLLNLQIVHCIDTKIDMKDIEYFNHFNKNCLIINKSEIMS